MVNKCLEARAFRIYQLSDLAVVLDIHKYVHNRSPKRPFTKRCRFRSLLRPKTRIMFTWGRQLRVLSGHELPRRSLAAGRMGYRYKYGVEAVAVSITLLRHSLIPGWVHYFGGRGEGVVVGSNWPLQGWYRQALFRYHETVYHDVSQITPRGKQ